MWLETVLGGVTLESLSATFQGDRMFRGSLKLSRDYTSLPLLTRCVSSASLGIISSTVQCHYFLFKLSVVMFKHLKKRNKMYFHVTIMFAIFNTLFFLQVGVSTFYHFTFQPATLLSVFPFSAVLQMRDPIHFCVSENIGYRILYW